MEKVALRSAVKDMLELITAKKEYKRPIEMEKLDFGQYQDHKKDRPYSNVVEGVNWYLNQEGISHIPDELILPMVAHNFGISTKEALDLLNKTIENEDGAVDLS